MAKSPLDVRLYRSSVKGRRPAVGTMAYGDLAVNYNHEDPALIIKGDDNVLIEFKPGAGSGVTVAAAAPASPKDGDLWWDTTSARLFLRYTSGTPAVSSWVDASPAAVPPALANALTYKGTIDPTAAASAPASPGVGDTYVASKAGTVDASWAGFGGSSVALHELMVWDGTEWDGAGAAASPRTPWQGKVDVTAAKTAGYTAVAGDLLQVGTAGTVHADWPGVSAAAKVGDVYLFDGAAWQYINAQSTRMPWQGSFDITAAKPATYTPVAGDLMQASAVGTPHADWAGVSAAAVVGDAYLFDGTAWKKIGPDAAGSIAATTTAAGTVQLADAAAITAGTAGRVVDAAQLKAEKVWSRTGTTVTPVTAGDLVDAAALPVATATALGGVKVGDNLQIDATGKLSANLASVLTYRGAADPTAAPPATPKAGDTYVASAAGTAAAGWTGLAGSSVLLHELLVWDGTEWDGAGVAAAPRTAWRGAMDVTAAKPAGYTAVAGDQLEASVAGAGHADWPGVGATVVVGDVYLFDGTAWKCLTPAVAAAAAGSGGMNLPPDPKENALLGWEKNALSWIGGKEIVNKNAGTDWASYASPVSQLSSVCWSEKLELFVAVAGAGYSGKVATSPDGVNWTKYSSADDLNCDWHGVCWSEELGLFAAVGENRNGDSIMTSPDGMNWTMQSCRYKNKWSCITWSSEKRVFVALCLSGSRASTMNAMTSSDGVTWTPHNYINHADYSAVCWGHAAAKFVAVAPSDASGGSATRVASSPDGVNWTVQTPATANAWKGVCWSEELALFVAVAASGSGDRVMTSPDGATWTSRVSAVDAGWNSVCWSASHGLFVAVGGSSGGQLAMTSPDGIKWTARGSAHDANWSSVCWAPGLNMFVAVNSTQRVQPIMTSPATGKAAGSGGSSQIGRSAWQGTKDIAAAKPAGYTALAGDFISVKAAGTPHADWPGINALAAAGDIYIFDGSAWHVVSGTLIHQLPVLP